MNERIKKYCDLLSSLITPNTKPEDVNEQLTAATNTIEIDTVDVPDRVTISNYALKLLSKEQRMQLAKSLIEEQVVKQRNLLAHWSTITAQSSMIDTGYIAQHLVPFKPKLPVKVCVEKVMIFVTGPKLKVQIFLILLTKMEQLHQDGILWLILWTSWKDF